MIENKEHLTPEGYKKNFFRYQIWNESQQIVR